MLLSVKKVQVSTDKNHTCNLKLCVYGLFATAEMEFSGERTGSDWALIVSLCFAAAQPLFIATSFNTASNKSK